MENDHVVRTLRAVRDVLEAAGSRPAGGLVLSVARHYGVDAAELGARVLAVLLAGHAARQWLADEGAERKVAA